MSGIVRGQMNRADARMLTEEVKADAKALWTKLLALYEGQAHLALGYSSWGEYYEEEFGQSSRTGYRLLEAARVVDAIESSVAHGSTARPVTHGSLALPNERVARELARADDPAEAWENVVALRGDQPTAAQTRDVVQQLKDPATDKQLSYLRSLADRRGAETPAEPISRARASKLIDHLRDGHACECRHCGRRMP